MSLTVKEISSLQNPRVKALYGLRLKKNRAKDQVLLAEGLRHILEGIENGWHLQSLIFHDEAQYSEGWQQLMSLLERSSDGLPSKSDAQTDATEIEGLSVTHEILQKLSGKDNSQMVLGVFAQQWQSLDVVGMPHRTDAKSLAKTSLWVALDRVKNPGNLGTILRTVDAIGGAGVILIDDCCDPSAPEVVRATMGSLFSVPLVMCTAKEFKDFLPQWTSKMQGRVIGTSLQTECDYRSLSNQGAQVPTLLLMGTEKSGLAQDLYDLCTDLVKMPMRGRADSLNLAVATGVMLYELTREWD